MTDFRKAPLILPAEVTFDREVDDEGDEDEWEIDDRGEEKGAGVGAVGLTGEADRGREEDERKKSGDDGVEEAGMADPRGKQADGE